MARQSIILKKVAVHNLKDIDLELVTNELVVFTGVSGSGKSSLAFDTIYVEGQRRYIESLSPYARRYIGDLTKPEVESVAGLSPTISIEQKTAGKNPRSTVGTMTEIYDYIRVLYARVGIPHCPVSHEPVAPQSKERIIKKIQTLEQGTKILLFAPYAQGKKGEFKEDFHGFLRKGFTKARVDGTVIDLTEEISLDKNLTHTVELLIDRLTIAPENNSRIAEAVANALDFGKGMLTLVLHESGEEILFSTHAYSPKSGLYYSALEPQDFSFNSPSGMCPTCHGLGVTQQFDLQKIIDPKKSIAEDCCIISSSFQTVRYGNIYRNLADLFDFDVHTPWEKLSEKAQKIFLYGTPKKWTSMLFVHPDRDQSWNEYVQWRGVLHEARQRYVEATSEGYKKRMEQFMQTSLCEDCKGSRLKPYPAATLLNGQKIFEITAMTVGECSAFFQKLKLDPSEEKIAEELLKEIRSRLNFLIDVGLHYLSLERTAPTLSGGEAQRVRLASQVGCGLVGVTYVLDEPSIGLHPRDNKKLIETLKHLRNIGNTVIVVEHDEETILAADRIVDFGPGPGREGGEILVNGTLADLLKAPRSLTGAYLTGRATITVPKERREPKTPIEIFGATHHNLKNVDVAFPTGVLLAITGVSGSGKSSLVTDTLFPLLANKLHRAEHPVGAHKEIRGLDTIDKVIAIDQSPIGRNPRSNPATYIKIFDDIRLLFAKLPDSIAKGFGPGRFSFNVKDGSCHECQGLGMIRVDMDFMDDTWVPCGACKSKRFDSETLSVLYNGKSIHDVLEMTVREAQEFFSAIPSIKHKLDVVAKVGMGYITLGQPSPTLSGGEAQRIKLARELVRPPSGHTFYILDEPTTGLHFHDIKALLTVIQELVNRGNSVLVIEHNMEVIKTADWIIDLGPEGGGAGGQIVAKGTPEEIAKLKTPTGSALREILERVPLQPNKPKKRAKATEITSIRIQGAEQNNLKSIDLLIPRNRITICTGPSGSGKSSLAFETVYAEGQRRYIESLSPYARQFVKQCPKPKIGEIEGLSPSIAIEQKASSGNPRSTVGTMTEIYDYLRILFARKGTPHCPETGEEIKSITKEYVVEKILSYPKGEKISILAPYEMQKHEKFDDLLLRFRRQGFLRIRFNGEIYELDAEIPYDRRRKNAIALVIDRLKIDPEAESRLHEAVSSAATISSGKILIAREGEEVLFNLAFAVEKTGKSYPPITPKTFSFNSSEGMCLECSGLGVQYGAYLSKHPECLDLTVAGLLRLFWTLPNFDLFRSLLAKKGIALNTPLRSLPFTKLQWLLQGDENELIEFVPGAMMRWRGIEPTLAYAGRCAHSEIRAPLLTLLDEIECPACQGARINPLARNVRIAEHSIASLCHLPLEKALAFIERIPFLPAEKKVLEEVLEELLGRLRFLLTVGLHYIALDRKAPTLSNGETQRIRLARQLGSHLTGILYVLDEPTIGLHPRDNARLNEALLQLKELGNTLLLVEHDPMTLQIADRIIDFGPGAGIHGGHITAQGTLQEIIDNTDSLTGDYLSGRKTIALPAKRRKPKEMFAFNGAKTHNLKNLDIEIPLGLLTCLTGVSGSGKSTLLHEEIRPRVQALLESGVPFDKMIIIDQDPVGHTVRSDVGTYVEVLPPLRIFYAGLAEARKKGLMPKHFSANHRKGMCSHCQGLGYKKVEMLFLPPVQVLCDQCKGMRLNPLSLEVSYQGKNFGQLLDTTVEEAAKLFEILPKASRIFQTLLSVGLGYLKLGQEVVTLSGGEAQRIKLSRELSKRSTGKTLYLLDEPTTGLHPDDIHKLLSVLQKLVDKGNTMIIIEHNLDVIKYADHIIDLGPEAGDEGGQLLIAGTPEEVAAATNSYTGKYLKATLY